MATITTADGQGFSTPLTYLELRPVLFEGKNTQLPAGVSVGPGNPPQWIEIPVGPAGATTPITVTRINVVTLTP